MLESKIQFKQLLNLSSDEINNSKIVLNMTNGPGQEECLDVWLRNGDVSFSYWSHYTGKMQKFKEETLLD